MSRPTTRTTRPHERHRLGPSRRCRDSGRARSRRRRRCRLDARRIGRAASPPSSALRQLLDLRVDAGVDEAEVGLDAAAAARDARDRRRPSTCAAAHCAHARPRRSPRSPPDAAGSSPARLAETVERDARHRRCSSSRRASTSRCTMRAGHGERQLHHLPFGLANHRLARSAASSSSVSASRRSIASPRGCRRFDAGTLALRVALGERVAFERRESRVLDGGSGAGGDHRSARRRRRCDGARRDGGSRARRRQRERRRPTRRRRSMRRGPRRHTASPAAAPVTIRPSSSSLRAMATISCCAFSTSRSRTAPSTSISSRSISAARFDMLAKKRVADVLARALERDGQHLLVGALDDLADAVVVDVQRGRRRRTSGCGSTPPAPARSRFDGLEHRRADAAIEPVEQLGHRATPPCCSRVGPPSAFSRCSITRRDPGDDVRRDVVEAGHPRQHVGAQLVGQQRRPAARRCAGLQVREDQRDRLRMLAEDELRELLRVGALERR